MEFRSNERRDERFKKVSMTFELLTYCIMGACFVWTLSLVLYLCVESANDVAELEELCHQHAKNEWI